MAIPHFDLGPANGDTGVIRLGELTDSEWILMRDHLRIRETGRRREESTP
jgi:hypothetical protein